MNPVLRLTVALIALALVACSDIDPPQKPPTATSPRPTATPTRVTPTATPPPPTPTPIPEVRVGEAIVVGGELRSRKQASSTSEQVGMYESFQTLDVTERVRGENWLVGSQKWVSASPTWASEWLRLGDGSFVYGAFVFVLADGEASPTMTYEGQEKWIDVDISSQTARAMVDDKPVFTARITSGAPPFETPRGSFEVAGDGRVAVEKMTSAQAGYEPSQASYDVERVLFTQYFDRSGDALHVNYWRPSSVFGKTRTSHGCVGLELHEAQYFWLFAKAGTRVEIH